MAFMKDILTRNIPIWEECAATPFVQEVQTGKLPLEKFKRYMIQDSIYLKNYARIYGKAIFHADTLREIQLYYSMLNFVNDTESEVRLDYLKQFCMTDNDIELIAPLPENQNYIDFMFEIASHGKNEEILMAVLPCMLSYSYIFRKVPAISTGPPFIQHVTRAVQRKADLILGVIVGAKLRNQLSDRSPLRAVQFSLRHNAYLSGALLCRPLEISVVSVTFLGCERASAIEFRFFCFGSW